MDKLTMLSTVSDHPDEGRDGENNPQQIAGESVKGDDVAMATVQTELAKAIDATDSLAKLDAAAKKLIRHKVILAEILHECVDEFRQYDVSHIEKNCIVGEPRVAEASVDQDTKDADSSIIGSNSEDKSMNEGTVYYDLIFDAVVPSTGEIIGLIINIEIQVRRNLPYAIITRAIYYLGRLISRQKGTIFQNSDYQNLRKVYSIWVCPSLSKDAPNSIEEYAFKQTKAIGTRVEDHPEHYDKMTAIIISTNDDGVDNRNDIIRLLSTLLSTTEPVAKRKEVLEQEFGIPMTKEIEEDMQEMCNFGIAVQEYGEKIGEARGREEATLRDIKSLQETLNLSAEKAMDALRVPDDQRQKYAKML